METGALVIVLLFASWIGVAGVFALWKPGTARSTIGQFASSQRVNLIEQVGRGLAGAGLIVRAPASLAPSLFFWGGWAILVSAAVLAVMPLRWHAGFAQFWSRALPLWAVRAAGVAALAIAATLGRAAIG